MTFLPPREPEAFEAMTDGDPNRERRRYRPPIGIPIAKERRAGSFLLAVLLHLLVILLLIIPTATPELIAEVMGAGGAGPSGGGGGGSRGTGGAKERLEFVNVAPVVPPPPPPVIRPPEVKPIIPPPPKVEPPKPQPPTPQPTNPTQSTADASQAESKVAGTGGGSGNDGSAGNGPGTGGGVGSGNGSGRGSGNGPGTGGGPGTIYPPQPSTLILPPMPAPKRVNGEVVVILFDIDSTGKVLDFNFKPTKDGGYNKRLRESLSNTQFRPATNYLGQPVPYKNYSFELKIGS